jgi:hypothetical protein
VELYLHSSSTSSWRGAWLITGKVLLLFYFNTRYTSSVTDIIRQLHTLKDNDNSNSNNNINKLIYSHISRYS